MKVSASPSHHPQKKLVSPSPFPFKGSTFSLFPTGRLARSERNFKITFLRLLAPPFSSGRG
jgi:hypothetical protein